MTTPEAFGTVLRQYREAKDLSQEDLSYASDLDRTFVSRLESGKRQPTISTIFKLADALGVSPSEMVSRVQDELQV